MHLSFIQKLQPESIQYFLKYIIAEPHQLTRNLNRRNRANATRDQDHSIPSTTQKFMGEMAFPFLRLPVELQVEVVNNLSLYSDLKAFCLISKALQSIATPRIYYKIDLRMKDDYGNFGYIDQKRKDLQMLPRIQSLLSQPANLRFVRVLKTGRFGVESTILMDRLLSLLRKDSLVKFKYSAQSRDCFPTPLQVEFLWGYQKHIQTLKLYSHMAPWLREFRNKRKPGHNTLFKSFTELCIGGSVECWKMTPAKLCWPLNNLDLCLLRSLSLNGSIIRHIFPAVVDLFASKSFVNLAKLSFIQIVFERTLTLTNVPSLKLLVIDYCGDLNNSPNLPLIFPDNFQLQSLTYWSSGRVQLLTHLVAQVRDLENLIIGIPFDLDPLDQAMTDFTRTVMLHKNTLRQFKIIMPLHKYNGAIRALKGNAFLIERIQTF